MSTPDPLAESNIEKFLTSLMAISELVSAIPDACAAYRAHLEKCGFSPTISEYMTHQYHGQLMAVTFGKVVG